ncbi:MAG: hypothetical protein FJ147_16025 [Deltaproteobacteria bacterium]|nr:hypothetical protein [Deltaproteobacteria bacterium]
MKTSQWAGLIGAVILLLLTAMWSSRGVNAERQAREAILEAQRHIGAVQDAHAANEEPATLRHAEDDLLVAQTAFNKARFDESVEAGRRASQIAQELLAKHKAAPSHQQ